MRQRYVFSDRPSRGLILFTVMSAAALFGALFGTMCCMRTETRLSQLLISVQEQALGLRRNGEYTKIMLMSVSENAAFLAAAFILGLSAVTQPLELALPFLRGIGFGVLLTGAFSGGACRRTFLTAAAVFPNVFISLIVTVLACREAMYLSDRLTAVCFRDRITDGMAERVKLYSARFAGLLAVSAASAAIECALAKLLMCT